MISDFRREGDEDSTLLRYYAESSGNSLPTFWDNLSVPSSKVRNYHYSLRNGAEKNSSLYLAKDSNSYCGLVRGTRV
jgi:hypothetical protein